MKFKVGIVGSTGYTGVVLVKLLSYHPNIEISFLSSEQYDGKNYSDIYPAFYGILNQKCKKTEAKEIAKTCDLVFLATPHGFSKDFIPKLLTYNKNLKIIDLSADIRLEKEIKVKNNKFKVAYGLPEIHREEIKDSQIIANPGCYPTSIILGLAPLLKSKIIDSNSIIADSKSGLSGAGKQPKQELIFTEVNESFTAYSLAGAHRHIPEIENEISKFTKRKDKNKIVFSPHLLPINRGILSTIYSKPLRKISQDKLHKLYCDYYKKEPFIKILPGSMYPQTKNVRYTNFCHITPLIDTRTNCFIVVSSIDNMVKGASGQAIQNMNIILSLKENLGLDRVGEIP